MKEVMGMADDKRQWVIRDVPNRTRRIINKWAGDWDVSVAEALERLIDVAESTLQGELKHSDAVVVLKGPDDIANLAETVARILEQRQKQGNKSSEQ